MRMSLRVRILLWLLPTILPVILIVGTSYLKTRSLAIANNGATSRLVVERAGMEVEGLLDTAEARFRRWIQETDFGQAIEYDILEEVKARFQEKFSDDLISLLVLTDKSGKIVQAARQGGDADAILGAMLPAAKETIEAEKFVSGYGETPLLEKAGLSYGATYRLGTPCRSSDGKINGAILAFLHWEQVQTVMAEASRTLQTAGFPHARSLVVQRETGAAVADSSPGGASLTGVPGGMDAWLRSVAARTEPAPTEIDGTTQYAFAMPLTVKGSGEEKEGEAADGARESTSLGALVLIPAGDFLGKVQSILAWNILLAAVAVVFLVVLVWFVAGQITSSFLAMGDVLSRVAEGDLTARADVRRQDEIGDMATHLNAFMERMHTVVKSLTEATGRLTHSSENLTGTATQLSSNAEETSSQANVVSSAAEQVSKNSQMVAAATEEMGASIREIAQHASEAARVATDAVDMAKNTNSTITRLGESSAAVGRVVDLITDIAEQTNLLALNATIEAARVGEAGKGFAVVANEVKDLARETAKATEDIRKTIETIQDEAESAVEAIGKIGGIIDQINEFQNTIACAVEEQTATTNEMTRNVAEAAKGSAEIAEGITGVAQAARDTTKVGADTKTSAADLSETALELSRMVKDFKV